MAENTTEYRLPTLLGWLLSLPLINRLGFARRPKEFVRFLKFATVGVIGMVVDLTVLNVMHKVFGLPLARRQYHLVHHRGHQQLHLEPIVDLP